jgi:hypothetical protein
LDFRVFGASMLDLFGWEVRKVFDENEKVPD